MSQEERHLVLMALLWTTAKRSRAERRPQQRRREVERMLRRRAVVLSQVLGRQGQSPERVAVRLGISAPTLRAWARRWREDRLRARPRGRPGQGLRPGAQEDLRDFLDCLGPLTGLPCLQRAFPALQVPAICRNLAGCPGPEVCVGKAE